MVVSERERVSHVVRRCSLGAHPDLVESAPDVDAAIAAVTDLSATPSDPYLLAPPRNEEAAREIDRIFEPAQWWLREAAVTRRPLEERLVWFFMDHFATSLAKVRLPDVMWRYHVTIRTHATGSFAELLRAVTKEGAMLLYLDGMQNRRGSINENHARELMELHTLGVGNYSQRDVAEAARALSGWVVSSIAFARAHRPDLAEGESYFVPARHDAGMKTILGDSADHDLDSVLDVLLEHPETSRFVATKLYRELVGLEPAPDAVDRIARRFASDYDLPTLVEAIVSEPAFTSDEAVRARVRTPLEKAVALVQAADIADETSIRRIAPTFERTAYQPFNPPNPAGYPKGESLLGPSQLVHTFELAAALEGLALVTLEPREVLGRLGLHDTSSETVAALGSVESMLARWTLAIGAPEFALT